MSENLTFDFQDREEVSWNHYCFHVEDEEFDSIFERVKASGVGYRSTPRSETDMQVNRRNGDKNIYWTCPDGHVWEILTVRYARAPEGVNVGI